MINFSINQQAPIYKKNNNKQLNSSINSRVSFGIKFGEVDPKKIKNIFDKGANGAKKFKDIFGQGANEAKNSRPITDENDFWRQFFGQPYINQESFDTFRRYGIDLGDMSTLTPEKLKQAYRTLALKYHPDKNPNGLDAIKEINAANSALKKRLGVK